MDTPCHEETTRDNNGRDHKGRFAKGNAGGPGNPFARQVAQLRKVLLDCLTEEDMMLIAWKLIDLAKTGNLQAVKLLFTYTLGKPGEVTDPDRLDIDEGQVLQEAATMQPGLLKTALAPDPAFALDVVRKLRPALARDMGRKLGEQMQLGETAPPSPNGESGADKTPAFDEESCKRELAARAAEIERDLRGEQAGSAVTAPPSPNGDERRTRRPAPSPNGQQTAPPALTDESAAALIARIMPFLKAGVVNGAG